LENAKERAIKLIKGLPGNTSLDEIIEHLINIKDETSEKMSIKEEVAINPILKNMIADSRKAYKTENTLTTQEVLDEALNRFNK